MTNETALTQVGQQIARREGERLSELQRLGGLLAASGYFSDAREMAQAAVKVMAGEELGIPPIASMMGISIIKGKVALGANLIASRIRAHGYDYRFKLFDATGCVIEFLARADAAGKRAVIGESSFNGEDAVRAGIKSEMYQKYPRNMYFARAMSNGARWYCPEVFAGSPVYTPEELGAHVDEQGDVIQQESPRPVETPRPEPLEIPRNGAPEGREPSPEVQRADTDLEAHLKRMGAGFKEAVAELEWAKGELNALTEGDVHYYAILDKFKMAHANQFKTLQNGRACFSALYREISNLRAEATVTQPEVV